MEKHKNFRAFNFLTRGKQLTKEYSSSVGLDPNTQSVLICPHYWGYSNQMKVQACFTSQQMKGTCFNWPSMIGPVRRRNAVVTYNAVWSNKKWKCLHKFVAELMGYCLESGLSRWLAAALWRLCRKLPDSRFQRVPGTLRIIQTGKYGT